MVKRVIYALALMTIWSSTVAANQIEAADEASDASKCTVRAVQDFVKNEKVRKSFHVLEAGQYDEAYDYYVRGRYLRAFYTALERAELNDPIAQTLVARIYVEGYAVPMNGECAAFWFQRAAEQGEPQAQLRYGLMLFNGDFVTKDQKRAEEFIRKAAEAGVKEAQFYYGELLLHKALQKERELAGVSSQNIESEAMDQALVWFLKGAALGDSEAAFAAAKILASGTLTMPKDYDNARKLIEMAADNNNVMAQIILSQWLVQGRGGDTDFHRAFYLLSDNAIKMVVPAQIALARLYRDGIGTTGDTVMAAAWYMVAKRAKAQAQDLETMLEGMGETQLKEAREKARRFISAH
ncbi:tetratricopeptide repeat family protein [Bartonella australis AUST/NH1]|uniref:Tetratricopeptide repeat family protein n=1 Tax=Bartonella australis (strain Aust/NH1) TaxID=1094489 RepID=M1P5A1_BARAA|nr:tetratricopeptide repeat protein [Bartonella australis]AGF75010.1 tetratricopeptide repeat family protein [Bartonella australis AUST/NH1]